MSLFRHLVLLPLSYFERRHAGEVASRFISIDRIQQTLTTASISPVVDGAMTFVLVGMMVFTSRRSPYRDRDHASTQ
jgi:ATP-binding cassette subfamily B protein RaxB